MKKLFSLVLFLALESVLLADQKQEAEKQIETEIPILTQIVHNYDYSAILAVRDSTFIVESNIATVERSVPHANPNLLGKTYTLRDKVPQDSGIQLTFRIAEGPYSGSLGMKSWPDFSQELMINNSGYYSTSALINIPEERLHVLVEVDFGKNISLERMRSLYEAVLKEAGTFKNGRTFFKAISISRSRRISQGLILGPSPDAPITSYKGGFFIKKGEMIQEPTTSNIANGNVRDFR